MCFVFTIDFKLCGDIIKVNLIGGLKYVGNIR
jgi:hypothetical protein